MEFFVPKIDQPFTVRRTEIHPDDTPDLYLQKLARITLDEMFQLVGVLTPEGILLECNRAALVAGGLTRDEVIGKPFWETYWWTCSPKTQEDLRDAIARAAQGEFVRYDTEVYGRKGGTETMIMDFTLLPVRDDTGHVVFLLPEGRDITEKKAYEREIARQREELAQLDVLKTQFFSNVSHEFRTPLTLMLGPLEDALQGGALPDNERERLTVVHRNGLRLLKLVNTLLDFSRIEAGRVQAVYEPIDLATYTAELASVFRSAIERAGLRFVIDCPALPEPVYVDRDMWEKIVLNLLSNAFKFTFAGQVVVVLSTQGRYATLEVRDTGTGIAPEELPKLFERFHQIRGARSRTHEGTGIGLALVQELVKLHGGTIEVHSELNCGTAFIVSIPMGSAHLPADRIEVTRTATSTGLGAAPYLEEALRWLPEEKQAVENLRAESRFDPRQSAPLTPSGTRPLVLLADDNADMRAYVQRLLSPHWEVEAVADGAQALVVAGERLPDLVLADIMMPGLDGFALLRALRADPRTAPMPVILLSARAGEEARVEGLEAGADDYLIKPFAARELLARVEAHLNLARLRNALQATLRESEARFRNMADNAPVMIWVTEPDGTCTYLNTAWYAFTGQIPETGLGFGWVDAVHPDDREGATRTFLAAHAQRAAFRLEYRLRRHDGAYRWAIDAAAPRCGPQGEFLGYIGSVIDITERQQVEEALRDLNTTLEQRVEERTALLALIRDVTRAANEAASSAEALQYALDRLCAYTGWPVGHVYLAVAPGANRWAPTALWHLDAPERFAAFQQATQGVECAAGEGLIGRVGACGQPEWLRDVATDPTFARRHAAQAAGLRTEVAWPVLVGQEVAGVLEFYTTEPLAPNPALLEAMTQVGTQLGRAVERERAAKQAQRQQEALLQQEKLAAMSTMLASVAHELNNPLATILLQAELVGEDVRGGPLAEPVAEIAEAAARCERLVRQFLTLACQHPPERAVVTLNTLVAEAVALLAYAFQVDNVTVHLHLDDHLPPLWGDPHQLQQVLINLLTNAQQALRTAPGAREVTCTTQYDPAQHRITLAVADTGPGIPAALQARIFEPFFTTKPPGVGTGLGLPLCRGMVEAHGGTLGVTSALGSGATFRITLPVGAVPAPPPAPPSADPGPAGRRHTILVVDDEHSLATGLARLLQRDGHTVDTAANGRLALARLAARAYDCILCDVRMPELDGPSLYRLLERQQPHLCRRLIFLTGDTLEPATQAFLEQSGAPRLTKPFPIAEARRAIWRTLGGV